MQVLITGGTGFIGSWIAKALMADGAEVRSFDISDDRRIARDILGADAERVSWSSGDITDSAALAAAAQGCDVLIHLAAVLTPACQQDPVRGAEICLIGSLNVFEAARRHGIGTVLYMSSAGVFGPEDDGIFPQPTTLYGAYKLAVEGAARAYWQDHGISSVGFRPLIVYGPGRETGLTAGPSLACRAAAEGQDFLIPFTGETDFIFVTDVAAAYAAAAGMPREGAHVYNMTGDTATAETFAQEVMQAAPGTTIRTDGPGLPIAPRIDPGALRIDYVGIPQTRLRDGITATVAHYRRGRNDRT